MKKSTLIFSALVVCLEAILVAGALGFGLPVVWAWRIGILSGVGILLFFLVRWHARNYAYECPECRHKFSISTLIDFISAHFPDKKYLRCPACGKRSWCCEIPGAMVKADTNI